MIVENTCAIILNLFINSLDGVSFVGVDPALLEPLTEILIYGIWVIGADLVAIFAASVVTWWTVKFIVGGIVWIWELLPLT